MFIYSMFPIHKVQRGKRAEKGPKAESKSTCSSDVTRGRLRTREGTDGATTGVCVCVCVHEVN